MEPIDHVGIAVHTLAEAVPFYEALLGEPPTGRETVEDEGVCVAFFGRGAGRVELLEPTDADSAIGRFLTRHGPGLHHICLTVPDLEAALDRGRVAGAEVLAPGIRVGAEGSRVAFIHPRSTGGVLLELREEPRAADP